MTAAVRTVDVTADVADVARLFVDDGLRSVPVLEDGRLAGIVSRRDLLRALVRPDSEIRSDVMRLVEGYTGDLGAWEIAVSEGMTTIRRTQRSAAGVPRRRGARPASTGRHRRRGDRRTRPHRVLPGRIWSGRAARRRVRLTGGRRDAGQPTPSGGRRDRRFGSGRFRRPFRAGRGSAPLCPAAPGDRRATASRPVGRPPGRRRRAVPPGRGGDRRRCRRGTRAERLPTSP